MFVFMRAGSSHTYYRTTTADKMYQRRSDQQISRLKYEKRSDHDNIIDSILSLQPHAHKLNLDVGFPKIQMMTV